MNKIEFKIVKKFDRPWVEEYDAVRIIIDGKDLIDYLKAFEKPFAKKENNVNIAGAYEGMSPEWLFKNLTEESVYKNYKIEILECSCGCEGCWDFLAEVNETEDIITWTNFENNHRGPEKSNFWDYSTFQVFTFDKKEYQFEINKLKEFINKTV
jgi:hypothetical protein